MEDDYAIGLNIGNFVSSIGVYRKDGAEIIPNSIGEKLSPSAVYFSKDSSIFVGEETKRRIFFS